MTYKDPQSRIMITPSEILEFIFCPRFIYFMNVLKIPQYEDNRYKVHKGRLIHSQRSEHNKNYLRKKLNVIKVERNVYLASEKIKARGIVDEIFWFKDGTMSPLDYKWAELKGAGFKSHKIQLVLYAVLMEEIYKKPVHKGYITYIKTSSNPVEIEISSKLKKECLLIINTVFDIIVNEKLPSKTKYRIKCSDCTYKNICV